MRIVSSLRDGKRAAVIVGSIMAGSDNYKS
jgi:hypothetical protein